MLEGSGTTRRAARSLAVITAGLATTLSGCGDGPICASEIIVVISAPADGATITQDTSPEPGIQIDVPVTSNLKEGDRLSLSVTDAGGTSLAEIQATSDANGDALFSNVTVPAGSFILRVTGASEDCGSGVDQVQVTAAGDTLCALVIREQPIVNDYYAPLRVLNTSNDSDPDLPNFQANIDVTTLAGGEVELFVLDVETGAESSAGATGTDGQGVATFPISLAQGRQVLRAECTTGAVSRSSGSVPVFVDTETPACDIVSPAAGTTIIPTLDVDGDPGNGTQVAIIAKLDAGASDDVASEPAALTLGGTALEATLDVSGGATFTATFDTPGSYELAFVSQDHAGNTCSVTRGHDYVTDGCSIQLASPLGAVTTDANGDPADGLQVDVVVQVGTECAGRIVTTDCGEGTTTGVVPADGRATLRVTACSTEVCEVADACTASVTSTAGIVTSVGATLVADNQAPQVMLQFVSPALSCGGALTPSGDVDGNPANGVQIDVRVISPLAAMRSVEVTSASGTSTVPAGVGGDTRITLEPGLNDIIAVATDQHGNTRETVSCSIAVRDVVVNFDPPIADGVVGGRDGVVGAGGLTLDLCGTASEAGGVIEVSIDGGAPQAATVNGTEWCLSNVTLAESPPAHTIDVTIAVGPRLGANSLSLRVDLTPAGPITNLTALAPTRQSARLTWTAPGDGVATVSGYTVKIATEALTDANFDRVGMLVSPPEPSAPGATEELIVDQLDAGATYYIAVASLDAVGNRSTVVTTGAVTPRFDSTAAIGPVAPDDGNNGLGAQLARGDFNGDGYSDLAVSAPYKRVAGIDGVGVVYVYFGGATGLGNPVTPDVVLTGTEPGAQFGNGLAAIQWGGDAADDLAVGVPYADNYNGRVHIFHGGSGFASATGPASANVTIGVMGGAAGGWFTFSGLGWSMTALRFDDDNRDDLAIGAVNGGGRGGVAVVYGGTTDTLIRLSDTDPTGSGTTRTLLIRDPSSAAPDLFGTWVYNLGRTEGTSDLNDDLGITYFDSASVYVVRGRAKPASAGVTTASIDLGRDLEIRNNSTDTDGDVFFGSAMASIADQNGDGGRDIAIGSWAEGVTNGRVVLVRGSAVGSQGVATLTLTTINPGTNVRKLGTAILNNAVADSADINNDGLEDLVIVGGSGGGGALVPVSQFVWYGGRIPTGTVTTASAHHVIAAPAAFTATIPPSGGTPITALWAGDLNGDGLEDVCWGDFLASARDGAFAVLWDDGV